MWIDKKRFHDLIEEYQLLNEDLDDSWLDAKLIKLRGMTDNSFETYKNNRKSFAEYKRSWYEEKKNRLANETSEERKERMERLDLVGNELFELFYTLPTLGMLIGSLSPPMCGTNALYSASISTLSETGLYTPRAATTGFVA